MQRGAEFHLAIEIKASSGYDFSLPFADQLIGIFRL